MILHIAHDEKFIDMAYRIFEEASPNNNRFVILSKPFTPRYIKKTPINFISDSDLLKSVSKYEMVIIHGLNESKLNFVHQLNSSVKLLWIGWGSDYYDLITGDVSKLFKPKTYNLYRKIRLRPMQVFFRNIRKSFSTIFSKRTQKKDILDKFHFFAPVLLEDYQLVKKALPDFSAEYISWNYGTLEDDLIKGVEEAVVSGNNILLGNSATFSNNHLDLFEQISSIDVRNRKIICPLSYGNKDCRDEVIRSGKNTFGESFEPLTSFMPFQEYVSLISTCSFVIMGHLRQQGLGNIVTMLYMGAKVFLETENPVYSFFKNQGGLIYRIDQLESELSSELTPQEIEFNREILRKHWRREVIINKTRDLITQINGFKPN